MNEKEFQELGCEVSNEDIDVDILLQELFEDAVNVGNFEKTC